MQSKNKHDTTVAYLGNFIEFLEFGLFAAFLPFISQDLFGAFDPSLKAIIAYAILYSGFLGRPIGGYLFGKVGDKIGVKPILFLSILGISISSFIIGVCPHFSFSWVIVALCRFMQGLFTGGEQAAATVFVVREPQKKSYMNASWLVSYGVFGVAAAQMIAYVFSVLHIEQWRYAFIGVSLVGMLVFYLRYQTLKNKELSLPQNNSAKPISYHQGFVVVLFIILMSVANSIFYLINSFFNNYQMMISSTVQSSKLLMTGVSTCLFSVAILFWGSVLDKKNIPVLKWVQFALIGLCFSLVPLFLTGMEKSLSLQTMLIQFITIVFCQLLTVSVLGTFPNYFQADQRVKMTGISINVGSSIIGGSMPLLASLFATQSGDVNYVVGILILLVVLGLCGLYIFTKGVSNASITKCAAA